MAVERSRSGLGGHAWLFFDTPVPATAARTMGSHLIARAMSSRAGLHMASYNRLFPSQDTLPRGGFGNLIALPLQHRARARDNSVFVDEGFNPWPDQWAYLASVGRISLSAVEEIAVRAQREKQPFAPSGSRTARRRHKLPAEPRRAKPPRRARAGLDRAKGQLPPRVRARLAQRLFIEKAGLPAPVLSALRDLAVVQNQKYYQRRAARRSTATTPSVLVCAEEHRDHIALPRGCAADAAARIESLGSALKIDDRRESGELIDVRFHGTLTPWQAVAVNELAAHDLGALVAPPGVGKTVIGIALLAERARSTLVLLHRRVLLEQWTAQPALFLDIDPKSIGWLGAGGLRANGRIGVATIQGLDRRVCAEGELAGYGQVLVDECHQVPARHFERLLNKVRAKCLTGLTATPKRRDGQHPILHMQLGPSRHEPDTRSEAAAAGFVRRLLVCETAFELPGAEDEPIQRIYGAVMNDEPRNELILDDVIGALDEGRSPIVLTERREHLDYLTARLRGFTKRLIVLHGGLGARHRRDTLGALEASGRSGERLVLATGRFIGEGFDDARLDTLFLTMPIAWRGTLQQYAGRLHRSHRGKTKVRIHDYADRRVAELERMFNRRLAGYRSIG